LADQPRLKAIEKGCKLVGSACVIASIGSRLSPLFFAFRCTLLRIGTITFRSRQRLFDDPHLIVARPATTTLKRLDLALFVDREDDRMGGRIVFLR
jgi:hypothetical protein